MYRSLSLECLEPRQLLAVDLLDGMRPSRANSTEVDFFLPQSAHSILAATSAGTWEIHSDGTANRLHAESVGRFRVSDEVFLSPNGIFNLDNGSYTPFPLPARQLEGVRPFYRHPSATIAVFVARNLETDLLEIWKTDGTMEGTTVILPLTKDVNPLLSSARFVPLEATESGLLYELADQIWLLNFESGVSIRVLEESGRFVGRIGDRYGLRIINDDAIRLTFFGTANETPHSVVIDHDSYPHIVDNFMVYQFQDALHVSDGSPDFTGPANQLLGIPDDTLPGDLKSLHGSLFYIQRRDYIDGRSIPARLVKVIPQSDNEIIAELGDISPRGLRVFGQHLTISHGSSGKWISDGTREGTRHVQLRGTTVPLADSVVYISSHTESFGREIGIRHLDTGEQFIVRDMSEGRKILDIEPRVLGVSDRDVAFFSHSLLPTSPVWFSYARGLPRPLTDLVPELWIEPELPDGTHNPIFTSSKWISYGDQFFFRAYTPAYGRQWWVTDGTLEATIRLGFDAVAIEVVGQVEDDWLFYTVDAAGQNSGPMLRTHADHPPSEYINDETTPKDWARLLLAIRREDEFSPVRSTLAGHSLESPVIIGNVIFAIKRREHRWWIWSSDGRTTSEVESPVRLHSPVFRRVGSHLAIQSNLIFQVDSQEFLSIKETESRGVTEQRFHLADDRIIVAACSLYGSFTTRVSQFDSNGKRITSTLIPGCHDVRTPTPGNGVILRKLSVEYDDHFVSASGRLLAIGGEAEDFQVSGSGSRMIFRVNGRQFVTDGTFLGTQPIEHNPRGDVFLGSETIYFGRLFRDELRILPDTNSDDKLDTNDVDALFAAMRDGDSRPDLNFAGGPQIDRGDIIRFVDQYLRTKLQDLNLDGTVGFDDFLRLSRNFGHRGKWSDGDIDGSGIIDFDDFLVLSAEWGGPHSADLSW